MILIFENCILKLTMMHSNETSKSKPVFTADSLVQDLENKLLALTGFDALFFLSLLHLRLAPKEREKDLSSRAGSSH
jgi:hypothetical protein